jgi:nucleotide-binding universal stress UspA family protein
MSIFPTTILLATDGSREARLAARTAADLAENTASKLHLVYVWQMPYVFHPEIGYCALYEEIEGEALRCLEARVHEVQCAGPAVVGTHLRVGRPETAIGVVAEEIGAGLIVMGSRGRGGVRRALMGSVCDSVVRHAHCPVLVVRRQADATESLIHPTS